MVPVGILISQIYRQAPPNTVLPLTTIPVLFRPRHPWPYSALRLLLYGFCQDSQAQINFKGVLETIFYAPVRISFS